MFQPKSFAKSPKKTSKDNANIHESGGCAPDVTEFDWIVITWTDLQSKHCDSERPVHAPEA